MAKAKTATAFDDIDVGASATDRPARKKRTPKAKPETASKAVAPVAQPAKKEKMSDEAKAKLKVKVEMDVKHAKAHIDKAQKTLDQSTNHYLSAGTYLQSLRAECKVLKLPFVKFLADNDIAKSTAYRALQIADGTVSVEEIRLKNAEAAAKSRAKLKDAASKGGSGEGDGEGDDGEFDGALPAGFVEVGVPKGGLVKWLNANAGRLAELSAKETKELVATLDSFIAGS